MIYKNDVVDDCQMIVDALADKILPNIKTFIADGNKYSSVKCNTSNIENAITNISKIRNKLNDISSGYENSMTKIDTLIGNDEAGVDSYLGLTLTGGNNGVDNSTAMSFMKDAFDKAYDNTVHRRDIVNAAISRYNFVNKRGIIGDKLSDKYTDESLANAEMEAIRQDSDAYVSILCSILYETNGIDPSYPENSKALLYYYIDQILFVNENGNTSPDKNVLSARYNDENIVNSIINGYNLINAEDDCRYSEDELCNLEEAVKTQIEAVGDTTFIVTMERMRDNKYIEISPAQIISWKDDAIEIYIKNNPDSIQESDMADLNELLFCWCSDEKTLSSKRSDLDDKIYTMGIQRSLLECISGMDMNEFEENNYQSELSENDEIKILKVLVDKEKYSALSGTNADRSQNRIQQLQGYNFFSVMSFFQEKGYSIETICYYGLDDFISSSGRHFENNEIGNILKYCTEEDKQIYNYLFNVYGADKANDFLYVRKDEVNKLAGYDDAMGAIDYLITEGDNSQILALLKTFGVGYGDGINVFFEGLSNFIYSDGIKSDLDYKQAYMGFFLSVVYCGVDEVYKPALEQIEGFDFNNQEQSINNLMNDENVSEDTKKILIEYQKLKELSGTLHADEEIAKYLPKASDAYELGVNMGNNTIPIVLSLLVSKGLSCCGLVTSQAVIGGKIVGSTAFGTSIFGNEFEHTKQLGYSDGLALSKAASAVGSEVLLDAFLGGMPFMSIFDKNMFLSIISEAGTEFLQEWIEALQDQGILGRTILYDETWEKSSKAAAMGAISSGTFNMISTPIQKLETRTAMNKYVSNLLEVSGLSSEEQQTIRNKANKMKTPKTQKEVNNFVNMMKTEISNVYLNKEGIADTKTSLTEIIENSTLSLKEKNSLKSEVLDAKIESQDSAKNLIELVIDKLSLMKETKQTFNEMLDKSGLPLDEQNKIRDHFKDFDITSNDKCNKFISEAESLIVESKSKMEQEIKSKAEQMMKESGLPPSEQVELNDKFNEYKITSMEDGQKLFERLSNEIEIRKSKNRDAFDSRIDQMISDSGLLPEKQAEIRKYVESNRSLTQLQLFEQVQNMIENGINDLAAVTNDKINKMLASSGLPLEEQQNIKQKLSADRVTSYDTANALIINAQNAITASTQNMFNDAKVEAKLNIKKSGLDLATQNELNAKLDGYKMESVHDVETLLKSVDNEIEIRKSKIKRGLQTDSESIISKSSLSEIEKNELRKQTENANVSSKEEAQIFLDQLASEIKKRETSSATYLSNEIENMIINSGLSEEKKNSLRYEVDNSNAKSKRERENLAHNIQNMIINYKNQMVSEAYSKSDNMIKTSGLSKSEQQRISEKFEGYTINSFEDSTKFLNDVSGEINESLGKLHNDTMNEINKKISESGLAKDMQERLRNELVGVNITSQNMAENLIEIFDSKIADGMEKLNSETKNIVFEMIEKSGLPTSEKEKIRSDFKDINVESEEMAKTIIDNARMAVDESLNKLEMNTKNEIKKMINESGISLEKRYSLEKELADTKITSEETADKALEVFKDKIEKEVWSLYSDDMKKKKAKERKNDISKFIKKSNLSLDEKNSLLKELNAINLESSNVLESLDKIHSKTSHQIEVTLTTEIKNKINKMIDDSNLLIGDKNELKDKINDIKITSEDMAKSLISQMSEEIKERDIRKVTDLEKSLIKKIKDSDLPSSEKKELIKKANDITEKAKNNDIKSVSEVEKQFKDIEEGLKTKKDDVSVETEGTEESDTKKDEVKSDSTSKTDDKDFYSAKRGKNPITTKLIKKIIKLAIAGAVISAALPDKKDEEKFYLDLLGSTNIELQEGWAYEEPGYKAYDSNDGDITDSVTKNVPEGIELMQIGDYVITYSVTNSKGETIEKERNVKYKAADGTLPDNDLVDNPSSSGGSSYNPNNPSSNPSIANLNIYDITINNFNEHIEKGIVSNGIKMNTTALMNQYLNKFKLQKSTIYAISLSSVITESNEYEGIYACNNNYLNTEASAMILTNGTIERIYNSSNNCFANYGIFYFTTNKLNYVKVTSDAINNLVIDSKTRNTFVYKDILVDNGSIVNSSETLTNNHALCQVSDTQLKIFSFDEYVKYSDIANLMVSNNCQTGLLLTSGDAIIYKSAYSSTLSIQKGYDNATDSIIFFYSRT